VVACVVMCSGDVWCGGGWVVGVYQKKQRRTFESNKIRETKVLNPLAFFLLFISLYCDTYPMTGPKTINNDPKVASIPSMSCDQLFLRKEVRR
jgi:hypothetical protein